VFCGTCGRRFFGAGTNCFACAEPEERDRSRTEADARIADRLAGRDSNPVHCERCGKEVRGQSGNLCATCEAISQREGDAKHKRRQKADREAAQKQGGGRAWRYR
jgi:hypothetical protein